jgi:anaerobic ribonucleoside-triphosphate reductase activating protein
MRIAGLEKNDLVNGENVSVSLFVQGCRIHCPGCFNQESWDFEGGFEVNLQDLEKEILDALVANRIKRNFSILGGEPLDPHNVQNVDHIIKTVRAKCGYHPMILLWSGYTWEQLKDRLDVQDILSNINCLISGPFVQDQKDLTLKWRGSRNQEIRYFDN